MIEFQCERCFEAYCMDDDKAGLRARCKVCSTEFTVPPAPQTPSGMAESSSPSSGQTLGESSSRELTPAGRELALRGRPFEPAAEEKNRKRNIIWLGVALIVVFLLPTVDEVFWTGDEMELEIAWPNIEGLSEPDVSWQQLFGHLFPGVAGLLIILLTTLQCFRKSTRGPGLVLLGVTVIGVGLTNDEVGIHPLLNGEFNEDSAIALLFIAAVTGLVLAARARWYRPDSKPLYIIGAIGGVSVLALLLIPFHGKSAIMGPFDLMPFLPIIGAGMMLAMLAVLGASLLTLTNTPRRPLRAASNTSRLIFKLLVACILFVSLIPIVSSFQDEFRVLMFLATCVNTLGGVLWAGGIVILLPIGIADLMLADAAIDFNACMKCGYDLRGSADRVCPECGLQNPV